MPNTTLLVAESKEADGLQDKRDRAHQSHYKLETKPNKCDQVLEIQGFISPT